jgi:hypothetical protein
VKSGSDYYFHVATAYDASLNHTTWKMAKANTSGVVSDLFTVDWASQITGLFSVFSGTWYIDGGDASACTATPSLCHLFIPASITDTSHFIVYETHAINWPPTVASDFSAPVAITVNESNIYDPAVWKIGSTYFMWFTLGTGSTDHYINLASSSSLLGPYTTIYAGNALGFGALHEGATMYSTGTTSWRIAVEDIAPCYSIGTCASNQMYYSDCNTLDISVCTWTALQPWHEDSRYRHGSIIKNH